MAFNLRDRVRRRDQKEIRTVEEIRSNAAGQTMYSLQLRNDFTSRIWAVEDELELVSKAENPESGPGFVPSRSIMD